MVCVAVVGAIAFYAAPACAVWLLAFRPWSKARQIYRGRWRVVRRRRQSLTTRFLFVHAWISLGFVRWLGALWLYAYCRKGEGAITAALIFAVVAMLGFFDVRWSFTWCRPLSALFATCIAANLMQWWAVAV